MIDRNLLIRWLYAIRDVSDAAFGGIFNFIDQRQIVRRGVIVMMLYQAMDVYIWAKNYALLPGKSGAELGLVIAALTVPVSLLQGFLFKMYDDSRRSDGPSSINSGDVRVTVSK